VSNIDLAVAKGLEVHGLTQEHEIRLVLGLAQGSETIIELGTFHGRLSRALAHIVQGKLFCVDNFLGPGDEIWNWVTDVPTNLAIFRRNLQDEIEAGLVEVLVGPTWVGAAELKRRGVLADFIFIDANHSYDDVHADISNYLPLLKSGGIMAGHDYGNFKGVVQAVNELLTGVEVVDYIWIYRSPEESAPC
jgi:hypothetical protein